MTVVLTGVSSFTGTWFARALAGAGYAVVGLCTRPVDAYSGTRRRRLDLASEVAEIVYDCPFGSARCLDVLAGLPSADALCHHGAEVANYKSWEFDWIQAVASNTAGLPRVLDAFAARGGRVVLVTGSVFEGHEGAGEPPRLAVSPYGLSKQLSGAACEFWCHRAGLGFGKFVIPNPFGPFEEPRLTAYLVREWRAGRVPVIATPDYVRDNIHVDLLARCYAGHLGALLAGRGAPRMAPSGYVERQGDFARRFAAEMRARVGWAGDVELAEQTVFEEPRMRVNTEPAVALVPEWREREAWDGIADYYSRQEALG